jgi:protein-S-isoprenylcysteine O-methyltransferase Ste14
MIELFRIYLFAGLLLHKAVWEVLKRRTPVRSNPESTPPSLFKKLVKAGKIAVLLFLIIQTLFLPAVFPILKDPAGLRIAGIAVYTTGLLLAILGRLQLGENWANIEDYQVLQGQSMVSSGVYRYIRHPIYTGDLLLLVGLELALNSWLVLGVAALAVVVYQQARQEESVLSRAFPGYAAYRRSSKMFIPYVLGLLITLLSGLLLSVNSAAAADHEFLGDVLGSPDAPAVTEPVYLPLVFERKYVQMPAGEVSLTNGPYSCGTGLNCYDLNIVCPQTINSIGSVLRVGEPTAQPMKGTILFFTGWTGSYFWGGDTQALVEGFPLDSWAAQIEDSYNADILTHLRNDGFRTVEIRWPSDSDFWFRAVPGNIEGALKLSCRPAAVTRWIYQNLHDESLPYCAEGHSNGGSQLAYSMSQYGLGYLFDAVVMESGPNWSRLDQACLWDDPAFESVWATNGERDTIDFNYGRGSNSNSGPCYNKNTAYRQQFLDDSLIIGGWQYYFPDTTISFIFGGLDTTTTYDQAILYNSHLLSAGSPNVSTQTVPTAPHFVTDDPQGAQVIEDTLRNNCVFP